MASPGVFSFFKILTFWAGGGGKIAKNSPNWKITITAVTRLFSGTV